ncbi:cell division site-positioning protein MapZ family protein [Enterococcus sp. DIV0876]|uniref:cell division site-positioning protein MapZ family protein n=1 Tax=Enterococcus sp. DIV0876 TaxID=2774633 RepID=UPI003D2FDA82
MEKTCPNCGFKAREITPICPNCGFKWAEIEKTSTDTPITDHSSTENDDIRWSDYKHVSIGEMEEQFGEVHRDPDEKNKTTKSVSGFQSKNTDVEERSDAPIFARKQTEDNIPNTVDDEQTEVLSDHDAEILSAYIRRHKGEEDETEISDAKPSTTNASADHSAEDGPKEVDAKNNQEVKTQSSSIGQENASFAEEPEASRQPSLAVSKNTDNKAAEVPASPKKKSKKIIYLAAAVCLVAVGGGWMYYHQQQTAAQEAQLAKDTADLDQIQTALNEMFTDQDHVYLKRNVTASAVTDLKQQLAAFKENERYQDLAAEADEITEKIAALTEVNAYFSEPAVVEDQLNEVSLKEAANISMDKRDEKDGFDALINQAITMGQTEYQSIQEVQNAVKSMTALVKDGEVPDSITRSNYNELMKKVQALPIESVATTLSEELKIVDTSLTKRETAEKAAAEKAAAEKAAAQKAAAEAAESANSSTTQDSSEEDYVLSPNTPTNTNNQPIIPARQSDLADTTNSAWNWAEGVKEKIIATAIARGYVVEGGYTFERVRIVDGQGYYNFYATNTEGSLLKGTGESALPMYLFTVNAKTGYFRGNGNDHTVR